MSDSDEVEVIIHANEEATEITVVFRANRTLSTIDLAGELEFLAHELSHADDQLNQPGVHRH